MSGFAFTRHDTARIARFVRSREARRPKLGDADGHRPQLRDVRLMQCTSHPNIEAIANGGDWPRTLEAIPVFKSDGVDLTAIEGVCDELGGGGGGGCRRGGCVEGSDLEVIGVLYPELTEFSATLTWVGVTDAGTDNETWHWEADGVVATLRFTGHREFDICFPTVISPNCTRFEMIVSSDATGIPQARYLNFIFDPTLGGGGDVCEGVFPVKSIGSGGTLCGEFGADVYWTPSGASVLAQTSAASTTDADEEEYDGPREPQLVYMTTIMNGTVFFGEIFTAVNLGGAWYAIGSRHSAITGPRSARETPHTLAMDVCGYEVPFIYWPDNDIQAVEGTRHLVAWVAAKRKYVMFAMGGCS